MTTDTATQPHPLSGARRWVIVLIQPPGYAHSAAMLELAEGMRFALATLGCEAACGGLQDPCDALLVLGAHLLPDDYALPPHAVIYNPEQLTDSAWQQQPQNQVYLRRLLTAPHVWDYSARNVAFLRDRVAAGGGGDHTHVGQAAQTPAFRQHIRHVSIGYVPELARIPHPGPRQGENIDVLFYGCVNIRRARILEALRARGLRVEHLFGVYGEARDACIARAKVVLNLHFYEAGLFEIVRVSYLLANRKAVVCEHSVMSADDEPLREGMAYVPYDELVDACVALVRDDDRRRALARRGFDLFRTRPQTHALADALGLPRPAPAPVPATPARAVLPETLHLGSGKDFQSDALNIDIDPCWQPDLTLDFGRPLPWGEPLACARFGPILLREDQFERIVANDVLEHIPDLVCAMGNALRLLAPGGEFHISVPYDLSLGAWQDPTHVRAFNENSWLYYTQWFWYLNWSRARFDLTQSRVALSPLGQQLQNQPGMDWPTLLRTPRAVDSLQVVLHKRYLTASERREYAARRMPRAQA